MSGQRYRIRVQPTQISGAVRIGQSWAAAEVLATGELVEVMLYQLVEMDVPLAFRNASPRAWAHVRVIENANAEPIRFAPGDSALLEIVDGCLVAMMLKQGGE